MYVHSMQYVQVSMHHTIKQLHTDTRLVNDVITSASHTHALSNQRVVQSELADNRECVDDSLATSAKYYMTKDRCVDNSCATPIVRTLHTPTVCCSLLGQYSMYRMLEKRHATKLVLVNCQVYSSDTTLLAGLQLPKCMQQLALLVTKP